MKYFVYITMNKNKTVLYTGKTNNLKRRLLEHKEDAQNEKKTFAGKYNCYHLLHFEKFETPKQAGAREKQIKGWSRKKKDALIQSVPSKARELNSFNPQQRERTNLSILQ
ncbi:MAG: GIY-YIG nuclease family protein [Bacteroidetes bacterium]|nr:MAG: GIY-YIG nuclease family protein [Bacteroidota bacterium]